MMSGKSLMGSSLMIECFTARGPSGECRHAEGLGQRHRQDLLHAQGVLYKSYKSISIVLLYTLGNVYLLEPDLEARVENRDERHRLPVGLEELLDESMGLVEDAVRLDDGGVRSVVDTHRRDGASRQ